MTTSSLFKLLNIPTDDWFLTGSRALDNKEIGYIISTIDSDYDFFVNIHHRHVILEYLQDNNIKAEPSYYNGGFKFTVDNKTYNIITGVHIEFMAWKDSLAILQYFIKTNEIYRNALSKKYIRYCIYEQLRGICKSSITFGDIVK